MSEKVVLPKFDLPGQGPHWAVKALIGVGALLGVSMLVLGGALWHHHTQQVAAEEEAKALAAQRVAESLAAVETAKAKAAESQAKLAAAKAAKAGGTKPVANAPAPAKDDGDKAVVAAGESHHKSSHRHAAAHGKPAGKTLAKGDTHAPSVKSTAASNKKKDDAIDKLLAQFK